VIPNLDDESWDLVIYTIGPEMSRIGSVQPDSSSTFWVIQFVGSQGQKGVTLSRSEVEYMCWRYIPHVQIIFDISLKLSDQYNLQRYGKEFSST
jgi:hypothetical protein